MTTLREAATLALEAICGAKLCEFNSMSSRHEMVRLMDEAITALKAALVEDALQKFTDVSQEIEAALAEPKQDGCTHCNHPMYAAIKCRVCGRNT